MESVVARFGSSLDWPYVLESCPFAAAKDEPAIMTTAQRLHDKHLNKLSWMGSFGLRMVSKGPSTNSASRCIHPPTPVRGMSMTCERREPALVVRRPVYCIDDSEIYGTTTGLQSKASLLS